MALPSYVDFLNPVLNFLSDGEDKSTDQILDHLLEIYKPTPEELNERIKSGTPKFNHRMHWAIHDLGQANLVERVARATYKISDTGKVFLMKVPNFSQKDMLEIEDYRRYRRPNKQERNEITEHKTEISTLSDYDTPEEELESTYYEVRIRIENQILEKLKTCSPRRFEEISLELLVRMGYGGSFDEVKKLLGQSHDGGVDGVIKMDRLGLENLYIQAKRWTDGTVTRPVVQQFFGALEGKANKGIILTSSTFSKGAIDYINGLGTKKIVLIDGESMAKFMFDHNVGVETTYEYQIKKLDEYFFDDTS